jgi:ABC-type multidrug transport system fused ATPase/permease subunit
VGRTGSGKSTLTLALLRAMPTTGNVIFDGLPTATVNLDALRSNIAFIPQVARCYDVLMRKMMLTHAQPELLRGTLRHTLDVRGEHDDSELNDALHAAGLFTLKSKERQLSLDSAIGAGGGNLSIGERQVCASAASSPPRLS